MTSSRAVGYLRALITVLVLAHHAMLAYHPFAPPPSTSFLADRSWLIFPVSDSAKSMSASLLVGANDLFFMSLMFFLSGLFVWHSLERKGIAAFLRDRARRLGLPFIASFLVLAPTAYYPSYLLTTSTPTAGEFVSAWLSLGFWPAGPGWFLWVLLAFDVVAATVFALAPGTAAYVSSLAAGARIRPFRFVAMMVALSLMSYLPLGLTVGPMHWTTAGPFAVQTSRVLHYLLYFFLGIGVGAYGLDRGLLALDGGLSRRWWMWLAGAVVAFVAATVVVVVSLSPERPALPWDLLNGVCFVLSCAMSSMAVMAVVLRFARPSAILDSLRDNAYGMYLVHYAIVTWVQYALLPAPWPGLAKAAVAFGATVALSWFATAMARRVAQQRGTRRAPIGDVTRA
jgi:peptidoglycan/LPS O-acetylase OafA/YrhL